MEPSRRPVVLGALAAGLLVVNAFVLLGDDGGAGVGAEDPAPTATDDASAPNGDTGATEAPDVDDEATTEEDPAAQGGDDTGGDEAAQEDLPKLPEPGAYTYVSSGTWSLTGGSEDLAYDLPDSASATVEQDGEAWSMRLVAGERHVDRFSFALPADGGLDWTGWVLERTFGAQSGETSYACRNDAVWYRPDEQGRAVDHVCSTSARGITSTGTVEHLGTEEVTLGDGTVVGADRLVYTYTVTGDGVTGEGRLDLWLARDTGLRLQEQRVIDTTTATADGSQVYSEDVVFTLQSLLPG